MAPAKAGCPASANTRYFPTLAALTLLLLGVFSSGIAAAQPDAITVERIYLESQQRPQFARLLREFGTDKQLPAGFELQTLLALSHYPQLKHVKIRFVIDDVSIPLSSRPHWASMLNSAQNRTYLVVIDNNLDGPRDALLLKNQPFNAQIGIIGHELAHTVYYLDRSFLGIVADAACQLSTCRIEFERATDKRLIDHGLGWQRYDHAHFLRARFDEGRVGARTTDGGGAYLNPDELLSLIEDHASYAGTRP